MVDVYRIAQRTAETVERDLHHVSLLQADAIAVAETIGTKEVDVNVTGATMRRKLEVVMLDVLQAVTHVRFASIECTRP